MGSKKLPAEWVLKKGPVEWDRKRTSWMGFQRRTSQMVSQKRTRWMGSQKSGSNTSRIGSQKGPVECVLRKVVPGPVGFSKRTSWVVCWKKVVPGTVEWVQQQKRTRWMCPAHPLLGCHHLRPLIDQLFHNIKLPPEQRVLLHVHLVGVHLQQVEVKACKEGGISLWFWLQFIVIVYLAQCWRGLRSSTQPASPWKSNPSN